MTQLSCRHCEHRYDGELQAWCPTCLAARWLATADLVRPKHDPDAAASEMTTYRSILTPRAKADLPALLADAAQRGQWYFDRDYGFWVHVTRQPLGRSPGVGIPAGRSEPDHALECLFIAEADSSEGAHAFAADLQRHEAQVRADVFEPLGTCELPDCSNLRRPGLALCEQHLSAGA